MPVEDYPQLDTYPDLGPPEVLPEGFATLKFLPGQQHPAPNIRWGIRFEATKEDGTPNPKCMPIEWQLQRVKKVASAMNHSAEFTQKRLREIITIAVAQEEQLVQWQQRYDATTETHSRLIERENANKQARMAEMQKLRAELHAAKKELEACRDQG